MSRGHATHIDDPNRRTYVPTPHTSCAVTVVVDVVEVVVVVVVVVVVLVLVVDVVSLQIFGGRVTSGTHSSAAYQCS